MGGRTEGSQWEVSDLTNQMQAMEVDFSTKLAISSVQCDAIIFPMPCHGFKETSNSTGDGSTNLNLKHLL
jgi:hypothetical protein